MSGIDPYASAVSDVYQDMFGEGSYAGKGIYDVDAFEAALDGRAPDARCSATTCSKACSLAPASPPMSKSSKSFPPRYDVGALRQHRWARGDWQLLPWILGRGPDRRNSTKASAALPSIGRWKMLDNLRRTLSAPFAVLALFAAGSCRSTPL